MLGRWPKGDITPIDGNKLNIAFANLCEHPAKIRESSLTGANFNKRRGKYYSRIMIDGKMKYLGQFNDPEVAHVAYLKANKPAPTRAA
jgi:hypothetical protein